MSARAAWRLESFGYQAYDYVAGKVDWLAAGLPSEGNGERRPRVGDVIDRSTPTCAPEERVADVVARVGPTAETCVVINAERVVLGRLRLDRIDRNDARPSDDVMEPGPATVRAHQDLAESIDRMRRGHVTSLIVSTPDGVLLGVVHDTT